MKKNANFLKKRFFITTGLSLILLACTKNRDESDFIRQNRTLSPVLENYSLKSKGLYPEGIDFDKKNNRFVISSFNKGGLYTLSADGKIFAPLITDANLIAALGVYTDETNDRIIAVSGDAGASEKSGLKGSTAGQKGYVGIYDAKTGTLIKSIDLKPLVTSGGVFPNDIALDENGNIYITDSFSPVIYKIDKNYNASIFVTNNTFSAPNGSFGLNGIVYKDGYLIVAHTQAAKLFKITVSNGSISEITGLNNIFKAPDGLEWRGNDLVMIENGLGEGKAYLLSSNDNWVSAIKVKESNIGKTEFPTAAFTADNGITYVLESYLGKLLNGDVLQEDYQIKGIKF